MRTRLMIAGALLALAAPAQAQQAKGPTSWDRAIAAGYKAAMLCSGMFNAGRTQAQVEADELRGIYPEYDAIVPTLRAEIDRAHGVVRVAFDPKLPPRVATWRPGTGCTNWPVGATATGPLSGAPPRPALADPRPWPIGDGGVAPPAPPRALGNVLDRAFGNQAYGAGSKTTGVVVLLDGRVVAERYAPGFGPFVSQRTWSVAKSIAGTLVGIATRKGLADVKQPAPVPEWRVPGDPRGRITLDQLLRMASGLHSDTAGNRTDAIYFGGATVRQDATHWLLDARPGTRFRYANNDILLAIRSLKRAKGYVVQPRAELFAPLGMTHTVAETDWQGDLVVSSQVWATARDLARLGQFWLQDGVWQGQRILPAGWLKYMTTPSGPQPDRGEGYGATMWLYGPAQNLPAGTFAAQGNRGQTVMVVPSRRMVIVRRGEDPTGHNFDSVKFGADMLEALR